MAHRLFAAVILVFAAGCGCSENTVHLRATQTFDFSIDGDELDFPYDLTDPFADVPPDTTEVPDGTLEVDICLEVCLNLYACDLFIDPPMCGSICARMSTAVRSCLIAANYACSDVYNCLPEFVDHERCSALCEYDDGCEMTYTGCAEVCTWYSDIILDCASAHMSADNCPGVEYCLRTFNWGYDCAAICSTAVDDCGLSTTYDECIVDCGLYVEWNVLIRMCLDTAVEFSDCAALAACGGIGL